MNKTISASYDLVSSVLVFCITGEKVNSTTLDDVLSKLDEQTTIYLSNSKLIGDYKFVQKGIYVNPKGRQNLLDNIGAVLKRGFESLHEKYGLEMPSAEPHNLNERT